MNKLFEKPLGLDNLFCIIELQSIYNNIIYKLHLVLDIYQERKTNTNLTIHLLRKTYKSIYNQSYMNLYL